MTTDAFNPSGCAVKNGNLVGLPFTRDDAKVLLLPVSWEATVSYAGGTALGIDNIIEASYQLDLYDADIKDAWKLGIHTLAKSTDVLAWNEAARPIAQQHIDLLESGEAILPAHVEAVNKYSQKVHDWVYHSTKNILQEGKLVGLVGGEHSTPFGYLRALAEQYNDFGILQIDAHCDLRKAYEGFEHSHASIFYNVLEHIPQVSRLVQVGIRDYCQEEVDYIEASNGRISVFYDQAMQEARYQGARYHDICRHIIEQLPELVYISFDIDGLDPTLCPNTGTPVAGGLQLQEAFYLVKQLVLSGRKVIGFDLCEVGTGSEWDGNVGARVLYKLCNWMGRSQGLI